ncbi:hypothetical protein PsorP6_006004 [Peronosclerospora sorghi]|uniref:Uncharacterized protein n=1 Tax=Peronosclerospora sorghi TaxID=230839 RepID=A0ACC0W3Z2_9STRA|nr:hypothetical protein PsorP6_006004 [Peronosclerospora sorghi]
MEGENPIPHNVSLAFSMREDLARLTTDKCECLLTLRPEKRQTQFLTTDVAPVHVAIGNKHNDIPLR